MWTEEEKQLATKMCICMQMYGFNYRIIEDVRIVELLITEHLYHDDNNVGKSMKRILEYYCTHLDVRTIPQHTIGFKVSIDNLKRIYNYQLD